MLVKNITVSVDDEVYHRARVRAAELRTSISALVRKSLEDLSKGETEFERLKRIEREIIERIRTPCSQFSGSDRLTRDQLHDRNAVH